MKKQIEVIGILDENDNPSIVEFTEGLNIITGKSSTGKSAMLEIFDYCMGSSEFTIPAGIITDTAVLYFVVIKLESTFLILGRRSQENNSKIYIREVSDYKKESLTYTFFEDAYFLAKRNFNVELGKYFGLDIEDTDESLIVRQHRGSKNPRPSVRHFMSFILQHQNLVANKHSLFYRFDEKTKREQTVEQFKIFMGFVDQKYYILKQELAQLTSDLNTLENKLQQFSDKEISLKNRIKGTLVEFKRVVGKGFVSASYKELIEEPSYWLDKIANIEINVEYNSKEYNNQIKKLIDIRNQKYLERRELENQLFRVESSIKSIDKYSLDLSNLREVNYTPLQDNICPFCNQANDPLEKKTNDLVDAYNWLDEELKKTPYMLDSFDNEKSKINTKIKKNIADIKQINVSLTEAENMLKSLKKGVTLEHQAKRTMFKLENLLEQLQELDKSSIESEIEDVEKEMERIKKDLKENYNVESKVNRCERDINKYMKKIGSQLYFEKTYNPINLKFSVDSFDLWHETLDKKKIYLRSMGSGANWMYSHICLFLALQYVFIKYEKALIPPILFLDQPSQVYFPNTLDSVNDFDKNSLASDFKMDIDKFDEDLDAVTNLFNVLESHCLEMEKDFLKGSQIIIIDHADKLKMRNNNFEKYVNGRRWRNRGFILEA